MALALSQPAMLGLTADQAARLQPLTAKRYQLMAGSPDYVNAASALPYCFSARQPTSGLASVFVPDAATTSTPVILFLHGYGGSFLWYQHYLSEVFSNQIIVCPAYGISAANIPRAYVAECVAAVSKRLGFPLSTPSLVGLSAGGFGACQLYAGWPQDYSQMICLGAYPPDGTLSRFARASFPRFLCGGEEPFVTSGDYRRRISHIRRTCPTIETDHSGCRPFLYAHAPGPDGGASASMATSCGSGDQIRAASRSRWFDSGYEWSAIVAGFASLISSGGTTTA